MFRITREFIGGLLNGLTHTSTTAVPIAVGITVRNPIGGSPYRVTECNAVRQLDGQFIIVLREYDGLIDYRYEDDRLNVVHTCIADYAR